MPLSSSIYWPTALGAPSVSGWDEKPYEDTVEFKPDAGPGIVRRRTGRISATYSVNLVLSLDNYNTLMTFYKETTSMGTQSFNWTHPFEVHPADYIPSNLRNRPVVKTVRFVKGSFSIQSLGPVTLGARFKLEEISSA